MTTSMPPNLFTYATSELSQDAVLCWLLAWGGEENRSPLARVGRQFVTALLEAAGHPAPPEIGSVHIERQVNNIDILCTVNGEITLLIEDKVGTQEHSNQLQRYRAELLSRGIEPASIYLQTGNQCSYASVRDSGYGIFQRRDLLRVLEGDAGREAQEISDILSDFTRHLQGIEDKVEGYLHKPIETWGKRAWEGFYMRLQRELGTGRWRYVPNPSGGFVAFIWHRRNGPEVQPYLQLEQKTLCFKIRVDDTAQQKPLRTKWSKRILAAASENGLAASRPERFGRGRTMTVAVLRDYRVSCADGQIDIASTLATLRLAETTLEAALTDTVAAP